MIDYNAPIYVEWDNALEDQTERRTDMLPPVHRLMQICGEGLDVLELQARRRANAPLKPGDPRVDRGALPRGDDSH